MKFKIGGIYRKKEEYTLKNSYIVILKEKNNELLYLEIPNCFCQINSNKEINNFLKLNSSEIDVQDFFLIDLYFSEDREFFEKKYVDSYLGKINDDILIELIQKITYKKD